MWWVYPLLMGVTLFGPLAVARLAGRRFPCDGASPWTLTACAAPFLVWDWWFTTSGLWGFDRRYTTGVSAGPLPAEECLFFFVVPAACLFIYGLFRDGTWRPFGAGVGRAVSLAAAGGAAAAVAGYHDRPYTLLACGPAVPMLVMLSRSGYAGTFWAAYAAHLPPFFLVNGILTALPVVWYHPAAFSGVRLGTIPAEDLVYSYLLLHANVAAAEFRRSRP